MQSLQSVVRRFACSTLRWQTANVLLTGQVFVGRMLIVFWYRVQEVTGACLTSRDVEVSSGSDARRRAPGAGRRAPRCVNPYDRRATRRSTGAGLPPGPRARGESMAWPQRIQCSYKKTRFSKSDGSEKFGAGRLFGRGRDEKARGWAPALNPHRKHTRQRLSTWLASGIPEGYGGQVVFPNNNPLLFVNFNIRVRANHFHFHPFH